MSWRSRGKRRSYWGYEYRPKIKAKGGIKAQSKRGAFGETWWGKRWIGTLESFDIGARLTRGKTYARGGQVLSIDIAKGEISAEVQGSFPEPYEITIELKRIDDKGWQKLIAALAGQAIFAAKLMAGEMPQEIEQVFKDNGLSLFPEKLRDLKTECSCPDWSNPCKHIAAVYYLIGEEFDRDPFLLFKLRGLTREELIKALGKAGGAAEQTPETVAETVLPPEPLGVEANGFWQGGALPENLFGEVRVPPVAAALPKRLGNFPFWRGEENFADTMVNIYSRASLHGLDVF